LKAKPVVNAVDRLFDTDVGATVSGGTDASRT
jgi:hypothetical protein